MAKEAEKQGRLLGLGCVAQFPLFAVVVLGSVWALDHSLSMFPVPGVFLGVPAELDQ